MNLKVKIIKTVNVADLTTDADMHVHQNELNRISTTEQNVNIRQKLDVSQNKECAELRVGMPSLNCTPFVNSFSYFKLPDFSFCIFSLSIHFFKSGVWSIDYFSSSNFVEKEATRKIEEREINENCSNRRLNLDLFADADPRAGGREGRERSD